MDSLNRSDSEKGHVKSKREKPRYPFAEANPPGKLLRTSVTSPKRRVAPTSNLNLASPPKRATPSTARSYRSTNRTKKRQNEIERLQSKLNRPLNSVEIDKLYTGYRKLERCTKRKSCECYHCELLKGSSTDVSALSESSTGSEDNELGFILNQCFNNLPRFQRNKVSGTPGETSNRILPNRLFVLPSLEFQLPSFHSSKHLSWKIAKTKSTTCLTNVCSWIKIIIRGFVVTVKDVIWWIFHAVAFAVLGFIACGSRPTRRTHPEEILTIENMTVTTKTTATEEECDAGANDDLDLVEVTIHQN